MTKRSLQASPIGIRKAKQAFSLTGWTQENLAGQINIKTRQPIWRFFTGQPVDRYIFLEICSILDLNCREIADHCPAEPSDLIYEQDAVISKIPDLNIDIDDLVKQVRSQRFDKIQDQCGILQMLDISHPISLDQIYIDLNILEDISSRQQLAIADLRNLEPNPSKQESNQEFDKPIQNFDRYFDRLGMGEIGQPQISGMRAVEKYSKLRVLGKPGAGKTTFLQHLAVQCNHSRFLGQMVPVFITLRNFVEDSRANPGFNLINYIAQEFEICGITNISTIETLLQEGRVLLLLDGMDEVLNQDSNAVLNEIRKFSDLYHKNRFVASCRMAAPNLSLRGFTDVEIAPFTEFQIAGFARKWFGAFTKLNNELNTDLGKLKSQEFMNRLNEPKNLQFRHLASTPLFLHLACWVFHAQEKFPTKRSEFYKEGLDLLLGKWDEARGIERDQVYRGFLLPQKLKLLSHLAAVTFEKGQYFFSQEAIEQHIGDYLCQLPNASTEPEEIQQQSIAILKSIESQHGLLTERSRGVFSFSYLVFQEYFTARKIVATYSLQSSNQAPNSESSLALVGLVSHICDPQWREVFLLTAAMLPNANQLFELMRQKLDQMLEDSQQCYYEVNQLLIDCLNSCLGSNLGGNLSSSSETIKI